MTTLQDHGSAVVPDQVGQLRFTSVNVGMGDCSIIVMPNEQVVVIDCGSSSLTGIPHDDIIAQLPTDAFGNIRPIQLLVLTHADRDHYSLVRNVIRSTRVEHLAHSLPLAGYSYRSFVEWRFGIGPWPANVGNVHRLDVNPASPAEYVMLEAGPYNGTTIQLVAVAASVPSAYSSSAMIKNTGSIVTVCRAVTAGGVHNLFLVAADATCETERFMLDPARTGRVANTEIMRVGHHGSDTSSSRGFVDTVLPQQAIVSSSENRGYSLPKESVVNRWMGVMPTPGPDKTVGFFLDGAGIECRGNANLDLDMEDWALEDLGLPVGYAQTRTAMYETFVDGSRTWTWTL